MSIEAYSKGTIKVVWITDSSDEIHSHMFETETEADAFGKTKGTFLIFSLIKQEKMQTFSWKLLPYGQYELYHKLMTLYFKHKDNQTLLKLFAHLS